MNDRRAVIFDLGKVLLDFDYRQVVERLCTVCRASSSEVHSLLTETPLLADYESGRMDSVEFYERMRTALGMALDYSEFRVGFGDIFSPIEPMIALARTLQTQSVPRYIFSNTNEIAISHVRERYPFFREFTGCVLSYEVGSMKPASPIYEALERLTGLSGPELFYLDDLRENIEAGRDRGWQGVIHTTPESSRAALRDAGFLR